MSDFLKTIDERLAALGVTDWAEDDTEPVLTSTDANRRRFAAFSSRFDDELDELDDDRADVRGHLSAGERSSSEHDRNATESEAPARAYPPSVRGRDAKVSGPVRMSWSEARRSGVFGRASEPGVADREERPAERTPDVPDEPSPPAPLVAKDLRYSQDRFDSSSLRELRRGTPKSTCDHGGDPAADMPAPTVPPGYRRAADGSWRYEWGGFVPGATDDCLARRYTFQRVKGHLVPVPTEFVRLDELQWVTKHEHLECDAIVDGSRTSVHLIYRRCWNDHARVPLGIVAPELLAHRMVDLTGIAGMTGTRRTTINAYRSRGLLPEPQSIVSGTPLWSLAVVRRWMAQRT